MDIKETLATAQQAFGKLMAMRPLPQVPGWEPTEEQRAEYVRLAESVLEAMDRVAAQESRELLKAGATQSFIPSSLLSAVRDHLKPEIPALRLAVDTLDPDGKILRDFFADFHRPRGLGKGILGTFEQGLQEIYNLIDRNPGGDFDERFFPDEACEVLDSKLIGFEPDSWLDRAGDLAPVRTDRQNLVLPAHVRLRLEEIYRTYVFGCWLSVLSLSRGILEYALLDNAAKFGVETSWPPDANGKRREKKLSHLIEDFAIHLQALANTLNRLRDLGNDYLHPKKSQMSKETLFARQPAAREAISILVQAVEGIYVARRGA